ncbi:MAG: FkbM family methyltransferase, partial [Mesorhizobium sp.]
MQADLVYDVGMNNGDDTAYYLHRGFRVVAIEADPDLCNGAVSRFGKELE